MEQIKKRAPLHLFLMVLAVFLSMTTVVFATVPLFLLRASAGRKPYVFYSILMLATLTSLQDLAFMGPLACSILLAGIFAEARLMKCSFFEAGLSSLLVVVGLVCLALSALVHYQDLDITAYITTKLNTLMASVKEIQPNAKINNDKILMQLPSAIVMIFIISLWLGQVGSSFVIKRYRGLDSFIDDKVKQPLLDFKGSEFVVPKALIWPTLVMMALAFIDIQQETLQVVASNFLNILIVIYFLQGLALVAYLFKAMEIGPFWQWFWYVVLILHMFLLVSSIGFADFWVNFRSKINKHFVKAREGRLK